MIIILIMLIIANNNIYSYITSSGPSATFTTFELLFLVSTVTLGKPLLSIKKYKTQAGVFSCICRAIAKEYASLLVLSICKSTSLSSFSFYKLTELTMALIKN